MVMFIGSTIGEAGIDSLRREPLEELLLRDSRASKIVARLSRLPMGPTGAVILLKVVSFSTVLLTTSALVVALAGVRWPLVAVALVGALALLGGVNSISRAVGARYGEPISRTIAGPVRMVTWLLSPILTTQATLIASVGGRRSGHADALSGGAAADKDLSLESDDESLDEHEVQMIRGVVRLDRTTAREIMVPRVDMVAVEIDTPVPGLAELMVVKAHSRIPVYRDDVDSIEGIAYARDILRHMVQEKGSAGRTIQDFIRPALFIPEAKTLEELLNEFQERRVHLAIVVDEYGGVSGIVTIEDLLEEIVGEIRDEFDMEGTEPQVVPIDTNVFMVDAGVGIDQLNELWSVSLEGEGFDTLGGFVYQRLGRIPSPGDSVEYDGLRIEVVSTTGRRLKRLRVIRTVDES